MAFKDRTLFNEPIGKWVTSQATSMQSVFHNASSFNQPLDLWDTSATTSMQSMFESAMLFNQPITTWDTGAVTTVEKMFLNATAFTHDLSCWNVRSLTIATDAFQDSSKTCWHSSIQSGHIAQCTANRVDQCIKSSSVLSPRTVTTIEKVFATLFAISGSIALVMTFIQPTCPCNRNV